MADEYIKRETAILEEEAAFDGDGFSRNHAVAAIKGIPAADVRPVTETNDAVDEALRILDAINSSGRLTYNTYCELRNAICDIYQDCL